MEDDVQRLSLPKSLYDKIEDDAVKLHIELGLELPVDPYIVAKRLGFLVHRFSDIEDQDTLKKLETTSDGQRDGLSYFNPTIDTYEIWINDLVTSNEHRMNFTIMHEIGHIRMGHRGDSHLAEMIANYYAAYVLIPSPLPGLMECNSFTDIMEKFDVSADCAYNCSKRCMNWASLSGPFKPYEKKLIEYYRKHLI